MRRVLNYLTIVGLMTGVFSAFPPAALCAEASWTPDPEFDEILALDIADLTVTSVSKRPQRLSDTAAAAYVITAEDLRRRGITSIPEALRMVPGMQVAQAGSNQWAVSARGFNNVLSNKLLVLIDGRTIYSPVFSGTYWDDKTTLIENIDRIEVIRGPGGTLWGANAVNGVINIITKTARETRGQDYAAAGFGTDEHFIEARHSGQSGKDEYFRTYGQYIRRAAATTPDGSNRGDDWYRGRSGFRVEGKLSDRDEYTVMGDAYGGEQGAQIRTPSLTTPFTQVITSDNDSFGGNVLGRWNHEISANSHLSLQSYLDHYTRHEATSSQNITTFDTQLQHTLNLDPRNNFIWGVTGKAYRYEVEGSFTARVQQEATAHGTLGAFVQDEYALIPDTLYLTAGTKLEYDDFTGLELEPNVRLAWQPAPNQTVWAAISRAVRIPSAVETDVDVAGLVTSPPLRVLRAVGNPDQESEEVIAYEIGHRIQPSRRLSFDTALFYNRYSKLATFGAPGAPFLDDQGLLTIPYSLTNLGSGDVYGLEESVNLNVTKDWRLSASYTYLRMYLDVKPGTAATLETAERQSPRNQFAVSSYLDLTPEVRWDNMLYYVDDIVAPAEAYIRYDTQVSWRVATNVEVGLIGRNLIGPEHVEFSAFPQAEIGRSFLGRVTWKF